MSAGLRSAPAKIIVRSPWMFIPPPLLFALLLSLGILLNRLLPLPSLPDSPAHPTVWLGILCLVLGGALVVSCLAIFAQARTTIVPHGQARTLVTRGPYRLTRNPMYLSLTLVYLGLAALSNTLWPLPLLILPLWVLQTKVIPFEEQTLAGVFGSRYAAYSTQVRRWL